MPDTPRKPVPGYKGCGLPPVAPALTAVGRPGAAPTAPVLPPRPAHRGAQRTPTPAGDKALNLVHRVEQRLNATDATVAALALELRDHLADEKTRGDRRVRVTVATIGAASAVLVAAITVLPPLLLRGTVKAQADISAEQAAHDHLERQRAMVKDAAEQAVRRLHEEHKRDLLIDRITAQRP